MKVMVKPYTLADLRAMQEKDGSVTGVISVPWDETGNIDALNDQASEALTGNEVALEDIGYKLVGADLENQEVLLEVTGTVENWLADQDADQEGESP